MISCRFTLNHKVSVKVKKCLCQTCLLSPDVSGSSVANKIHYFYWVRASLMCIVIIMKVPWCSLNGTALGNVKALSLFLHCELKIKLNYTQEVNCWQDTVYSVVVMGTGAQSAFHSKHICISVAGAFFCHILIYPFVPVSAAADLCFGSWKLMNDELFKPRLKRSCCS